MNTTARKLKLYKRYNKVTEHSPSGSAACQSNPQETIQMMEVNFVRMISYPAELCLRCHRDHLRKESGTDTAM